MKQTFRFFAAVIASISFFIFGFAYPLIFRRYAKALNLTHAEEILPILMSVLILVIFIVGVVSLWVNWSDSRVIEDDENETP